jgi:hypothetical protein
MHQVAHFGCPAEAQTPTPIQPRLPCHLRLRYHDYIAFIIAVIITIIIFNVWFLMQQWLQFAPCSAESCTHLVPPGATCHDMGLRHIDKYVAE